MKTLTTLLIAVLAASALYAQTGPLTGADSLMHPELVSADSLRGRGSDSLLQNRSRVAAFPIVINAVLQDFPNNLRNISGELLLAQGEFENYASMLELPGAENCMVTRYHSIRDTTASWQAKMFQGDDFDKAARTYRELYGQLQTCYIQLKDGTLLYLKGQWESAREGASFTTSTLRLTTTDWRYKDVKVELELVYLLADWAVNINIVSKRPDNEVGGGVGAAQ